MVDIFISYSRKDIVFTKIVHQTFQESNLETRIDWQDILPSTNQIKEIKKVTRPAGSFEFNNSLIWENRKCAAIKLNTTKNAWTLISQQQSD